MIPPVNQLAVVRQDQWHFEDEQPAQANRGVAEAVLEGLAEATIQTVTFTAKTTVDASRYSAAASDGSARTADVVAKNLPDIGTGLRIAGDGSRMTAKGLGMAADVAEVFNYGGVVPALRGAATGLDLTGQGVKRAGESAPPLGKALEVSAEGSRRIGVGVRTVATVVDQVEEKCVRDFVDESKPAIQGACALAQEAALNVRNASVRAVQDAVNGLGQRPNVDAEVVD